jgi:hypothetical protein
MSDRFRVVVLDPREHFFGLRRRGDEEEGCQEESFHDVAQFILTRQRQDLRSGRAGVVRSRNLLVSREPICTGLLSLDVELPAEAGVRTVAPGFSRGTFDYPNVVSPLDRATEKILKSSVQAEGFCRPLKRARKF